MLLKFSLPIIGLIEFPTYMTLLMLGFAFGIWGLYREGRRVGVDPERYLDLGLWMIVFGIMGARFLSVLADGRFHDFVHRCTEPTLVAIDPTEKEAHINHCTTAMKTCGSFFLCNDATGKCYPPRDCLLALKFWYGGMAYYGGFIGASAFGLWYAKKHKLGVWRTADAGAPFIALGLAFGRMGCFFNGCCYGERTESSIGLVFPTKPDGPRHPTQLYECLAAIAIFVTLLAVRERKREHGEVFGALLVLYGIARFLLEFWRDDPRGALLGLSTSQLLSIPLVAAGIWLYGRSRLGGAQRDLKPAEAK